MCCVWVPVNNHPAIYPSSDFAVRIQLLKAPQPLQLPPYVFISRNHYQRGRARAILTTTGLTDAADSCLMAPC